MSNKDYITLHQEHGLAPALTFCRICGGDTNELALLGNKADSVMRSLGHKDGYRGSSAQRIPSQGYCDKCEAHLKNGGAFFIAEDLGEYLRLDKEQLESLQGRVVDAKGRGLDFLACSGRVIVMKHGFWLKDEEGNIRLRDPKVWTQ